MNELEDEEVAEEVRFWGAGCEVTEEAADEIIRLRNALATAEERMSILMAEINAYARKFPSFVYRYGIDEVVEIIGVENERA